MKRLACFVLILALLLALAACGEPDPNAGLYEATSVNIEGINLSVESIFDGSISIELKNNSRAVMTMGGEDYNLKWSLDGTALSIIASDATMTGTLENNIIVLDISGYSVTFVRTD